MSLRNRIIIGAVTAAVSIATPVVMYFEGKENHAYLDPVGIATICYGSTVGVRLSDYKSDHACDALLEKELTEFAVQVDKEILIPVRPNVLAALTSFSYNVGINAFKTSTALKRINQGNIKGGCEALGTKDYSSGICRGYGCGWAGGKMLKGLQRRRQEEMRLCLQ